ncbi:hypothetical protein DVR12_16790 [Chitinophaga silvatica]|uniref:Uncharacterized protein n=1 Tax=Chitinophaga silvatica TaxID=2282649 RepID=A0A3E1Y7I7_9BACT|nr:hypothetical protein [Chitinophaga silvatica]RFS21006.1 hypothetical protein DVR12_16790 [Chitinophaga silvatica]
MRLLLLAAITFLHGSLRAQTLWSPTGRHTGLGSYSNNFQNVFSTAYQPAGLANIPLSSAGVYTERRFMLKELALYILDAAFHTAKGGIGTSLIQTGNKYWHQQLLALAYGKQLSKNLGIGLHFNYTITSTQGMGSEGSVGFRLGGIWHTNKQLHIGCLLAKEQNKSIIGAGLGFEASKDCLVTAEIINWANYFQAKLGFIYRVASALAILAGGGAGTQQNFAGFNIYWNAWTIGFTSGFHTTLGITPSIALSWQQAAK